MSTVDVEHIQGGDPIRRGNPEAADPITTEVIRHALISATGLMKSTLRRTAFTVTIYEHLDFACALYDREVRLLAQAPSLPIFLGTLSFCVKAVVEGIGGEQSLQPGDILLSTYGYHTGSHPQDAAVVMPVFCDDILSGYAVIKAHWTDIAAKDPYCTDTVDNFQEGTIYPGVRLYRAGKLQDDLYRTVLANSRFPDRIEGDLNAQISGVKVGARQLCRLITKHGRKTFEDCVERMFDHGERQVRDCIQGIPDGVYSASGIMDNDGITDDEIPFEIQVEIKGTDIMIDYTKAPPQRPGPVNCPLPGTVSASRVAVCALVGIGESSHEGHFRPLKVRARKGTIFHPTPPAPIFLYGWPMFQAIEVITLAISHAMPQAVPAGSGGDICGVNWWGTTATGTSWYQAGPHAVGQGAGANLDGANALMHIGTAATGETPVEMWEARYPVLIDKWELATDSGGAGKHRGGLGVDFDIRMLDDCFVTVTFERTKHPGWGLTGGCSGRSNGFWVAYPDGTRKAFIKATRVPIPKGAVLEFRTGGGGGWGHPRERDPLAISEDIRSGYASEEQAYKDYPHAFKSAEIAQIATP